MNLSSLLATCRSELAAVRKSMARLALWCILIFIGAQIVFALQERHFQTGVAFASMFVSFLAIAVLAAPTKISRPQRATWIGVHAGIITLGIAVVVWAPAWSGYLVGIPFVLFAVVPNVLVWLGSRRLIGGHNRSAAICGRLVYLCHPSRHYQFFSSLWAAHALVSAEERISAYRALAVHATAEQLVVLNYFIAIAKDDWEGVLRQSRSASETESLPKRLEIRALGEIGQVEEMMKTYALAGSILRSPDLILCWLYVMAFSGYIDEVRSLLRQQLRFFRPRNKAYWIFIADQAAGAHEEDARRALESFTHAADDETFRRAAQRHLAKAPVAGKRITDPSVDYRAS
jgi:hypothetical protein